MDQKMNDDDNHECTIGGIIWTVCFCVYLLA